MEYSPAVLASLTVQAIVLGVVLGVLYSVLELTRLVLGEGQPATPQCFFRRIHALSQPVSATPKKKPRARRVFLFLLRFFEDVFFCLSLIIGIILLAYVGNNGRIRWFILLGVLVGFVVYMGTIGVLFSRISSGLAVLIRWVARSILYVMMLPLKMMLRGIKSVLLSCKRVFERHILERKNEKYHIAEMKQILGSASDGFGCIQNSDLTKQALFDCNTEGDTHKTKDVKKKERRSVYGRTEKSEYKGKESPKDSPKA